MFKRTSRNSSLIVYSLGTESNNMTLHGDFNKAAQTHLDFHKSYFTIFKCL